MPEQVFNTAEWVGLTACTLASGTLTRAFGPAWLGDIRGPFPAMRFVAVGGVDHVTAADYLRAGAAGVGFGSSIERVLQASDPAGAVTPSFQRAVLVSVACVGPDAVAHDVAAGPRSVLCDPGSSPPHPPPRTFLN